MRKIWLLVITLLNLVASQVTLALQFDHIAMHSYQGQKLNTRVYIKSLTDQTANNLQVTLAPIKYFQVHKLPLTRDIARLQFSIVEPEKSAAPYLLITSTQPIRYAKKLNFLIAIKNIKTKQTQIFKLNLSLPVKPLYSNHTATFHNYGNENKTLTYGPTTTKDNLYRIALQMRSSNQISAAQMMLAIVKRNPQAFYQQNVNGLQAGRILQMPSTMMILSFTKDYAKREVARQNAVWKSILQQQTNMKMNYVKKKQLEQQSDPQVITDKQTQAIKAEQQVEDQQPQDQKEQQQKPLVSTVEAAYKVRNAFSIGYQSGNYKQRTTGASFVNREDDWHGLRYIRFDDKISGMLSKFWYAEADLGYGYAFRGRVIHTLYSGSSGETVDTAYDGRAYRGGDFDSMLAVGHPIEIGGDFYNPVTEIIPVVGLTFNEQRYTGADLHTPTTTTTTESNLNSMWYGISPGLEFQTHINKLMLGLSIFYSYGKHLTNGETVNPTGTVHDKTRAHGLEAEFLSGYQLNPHWQLRFIIDWQKWRAEQGYSEITASGVEYTGNVNKAIWEKQSYSVGLASRF